MLMMAFSWLIYMGMGPGSEHPSDVAKTNKETIPLLFYIILLVQGIEHYTLQKVF